MALNIETFSNAKGGNAFFKAIGHPLAARQAKDLLQRLRAGPVAIYDPLGYAQAFAEIYDLSALDIRSEEHTSELQSLMRISYAVFCLQKKKHNKNQQYRVHTRTINRPKQSKSMNT